MRFYFFRHAMGRIDGLHQEVDPGPAGAELIWQQAKRHFHGRRLDAVLRSQSDWSAFTSIPIITESGCGSPNLWSDGSTSLDSVDEWWEKGIPDRRWRKYLLANDGKIDPTNPFVAAQAATMASAIVRESAIFPESSQVLAVGYGGRLEALIHKLTGVLLKPLLECEGAIVDYVDGKFTLVEELRR
ncbi:MAG: hypothetical protein WC551_00230 [Patescibacteria group bacterium]